MCGICGQFSISPRPADTGMWNFLVDGMRQRGPDDRGLVHDAHCVLGARRLSILDESSAGHLPMEAESGRFRLVFNGELYNFREMRRELEGHGYRFRSTGDSEVVLRAMQHWGIGALDRFNGMFALAFYDRDERELVLARDHAGIKPLYVLEDRRGLVFASQFDQIMGHPWARNRSPDPDAVAMYLRIGHIPAPRAYLRGTRMIEPGSWMRIDGRGRVRSGRYFRFEDGETTAERPDREEIEATLREAVIRQSVSDVPVGCFLSGGIDSPLIAAYLSESPAGPPPVFSIGVSGPDLDESADASRYARALGAEYHVGKLGEAEALDLLDDVLAATQEPLADEGILPSLAVAELARREVTVALSGEGGDELFWGYYPRQAAMLSPDPADNEPAGARYLSFFSEFRRSWFERIFPGLPWWPPDEPGYDFDAADPEAVGRAMRRCEFDAYLPFILLKTDRASMHHSLEVRVPLLDRAVIEMARRFRIRDCLDLERGLGKLPLRRALRDRVGFATSGKRGFTVPIGDWFRNGLRGSLGESLRSLRGLESIDVDRSALGRFERAHRRGEANHGMALWRLYCLDLWVKKQKNLGVECGLP